MQATTIDLNRLRQEQTSEPSLDYSALTKCKLSITIDLNRFRQEQTIEPSLDCSALTKYKLSVTTYRSQSF
jgi:hypothetical protein